MDSKAERCFYVVFVFLCLFIGMLSTVAVSLLQDAVQQLPDYPKAPPSATSLNRFI